MKRVNCDPFAVLMSIAAILDAVRVEVSGCDLPDVVQVFPDHELVRVVPACQCPGVRPACGRSCIDLMLSPHLSQRFGVLSRIRLHTCTDARPEAFHRIVMPPDPDNAMHRPIGLPGPQRDHEPSLYACGI